MNKIRHFWQLLINNIGNDVVEVSPGGSTNILRHVTDPEKDFDAATKGWINKNFQSSGVSIFSSTTNNIPIDVSNNIYMSDGVNSITFGKATDYPKGFRYVIYSYRVWETYTQNDYQQVLFSNNDLLSEEQNIIELMFNDYLEIMNDGTNWVIISAPKNKIQRTITANYTLKSYDKVVLVDATAGNVLVKLPTLQNSFRVEACNYYIKRIDNSVNTVTISGNGYLMDGKITIDLIQYQGHNFYGNSSAWNIISNKSIVDPAYVDNAIIQWSIIMGI